jgi:hypothetical protein
MSRIIKYEGRKVACRCRRRRSVTFVYFRKYTNLFHSGLHLIDVDALKSIVNYLISEENNNQEHDEDDELPVKLIKSLHWIRLSFSRITNDTSTCSLFFFYQMNDLVRPSMSVQ